MQEARSDRHLTISNLIRSSRVGIVPAKHVLTSCIGLARSLGGSEWTFATQCRLTSAPLSDSVLRAWHSCWWSTFSVITNLPHEPRELTALRWCQ